MVKANCLIDIPVEVERVNPGDPVSVQLLSGEAWVDQGGPCSVWCPSPLLLFMKGDQ